LPLRHHGRMRAIARLVFMQRADDVLRVLAGDFRHRILRVRVVGARHAVTTIARINECAAIGFVASGMGGARESKRSGYSHANQLQSSHQEDPHGSSGRMQRIPRSIEVATERSQYRATVGRRALRWLIRKCS
jgi:hypothetical protein